MNNLPRLAICMVTYKRTSEALETIRSTCQNLGYPRELIGWYIADDGSDPGHHETLLHEISGCGFPLIGHHNDKFRNDDTHNCGKGWNKGLGLCHQWSDYVLWLEDDWRMDFALNVIPYVELLRDVANVGIVSFRILSIGADVHTVGHDGQIYLKYLRTTQYAYSGNPLLRHARYALNYGWFAEDRNPGLIELHQDDMYRLDVKSSPEIWRPFNLDPWGGWHHIGTDKTW